jgi:DNA-binding transcriptional LysR family regulator
MKIKDLKLFTHVVELNGFTAAANALDLPRANVSRRISELEHELGVKLFYRTTRRLSLTQQGEEYYNALLDALKSLDRANDVVMNEAKTPKGKVKLGLMPESDESLQPLLFKFQNLYPEISLDIRNISNGFADLYRLGLDIVVHSGKIENTDVVARKLIGLPKRLVATPTYIEEKGGVSSIADLQNHVCVCYRLPNGNIDDVWEIGGKPQQVQSRLNSNNIGFVKRAVLQHQGIGCLPSILVDKEIESGQLCQLLAHEQFTIDNVWLLFPERKNISRSSQLLIDFLIQEVPSIAGLS